MATPELLAQQISFGLERLKARNGHHEFEELCRHLARARICSNLLPASGPVSAGGDQGRDFETFRTYLHRELGADAAFVGLASETLVSFACTLTSSAHLERKVRSDVDVIARSGQRCDVHYFCSEALPVARRHALQAWAGAQHGIHLEIFDREAIAELLSARDTFWIAAKLLRVPADLLQAAAVAQAPPLPPGFVERREVAARIKRALLDAVPAAGGLVRCALHGLPGGGKSTLAAALAHDPEIRARFPDGVLWVTLGQEPNLPELLASWLQALGDAESQPRSLRAATDRLRSELRDRRCLLVVDDAWEGAHVEPFVAGGEGCRFLLTTRDLLVARVAGVEVHVEVGPLTREEAMCFVPRRLGRPLADGEERLVEEIATLLGYLPLALELVTALVVSGEAGWPQVRSAADAEIVRLAALDPPGLDEVAESLRKRLSLRVSFNLTLGRLPEPVRNAFGWLGVLQDDAAISVASAATLWEAETERAREILLYLRAKGLLSPGAEPDTFKLHDLLHDAARELLSAPRGGASGFDGLHVELPDAHAELLARYRPAAAGGGGWHVLQEDGYIYEHLTWHLQRAGRGAELHALFRGAAGRDWYLRRDELGQAAGYLGDLDRALRAVRATAAGDLPPGGLELRYLLIAASLNAVVRKVPLSLLVALVRQGVWRLEKALDYARKLRGAAERERALGALAPLVGAPRRSAPLPERAGFPAEPQALPARTEEGAPPVALDLDAAFEAVDLTESAGGIIDDDEMEKVFRLLRDLPPDPAERLVSRLLEVASYLHYEDRSRILAAVGPRATEEQLAAAIAEDVDAVPILEPWLTTPRLLEGAVNRAVRAGGRTGLPAIEAVAPRLPPELLQKAVPVALQLSDEDDRREAALSLALASTSLQAWEPAVRMATAARRLDRFVAAVADVIPPYWARRILISDRASAPGATPGHISRGLLSLRLPEAEREPIAAALLAEAREVRRFDRIEEVGGGYGYSWEVDEGLEELLRALVVLVARSGFFLEEAVAMASDRRWWRHAALVEIAPWAGGELRDRILAELSPRAYPHDGWAGGVSLAESERSWARAIAPVAHSFDAGRRFRAAWRARGLKDPQARALALAALGAAAGRPKLTSRALRALRSLPPKAGRAETAAALAPYLEPTPRTRLLLEVLDAAAAAGGLEAWVKAFEAIAPSLPAPERRAALGSLLEGARPLTCESLRTLGAVAEHLHLLDTGALRGLWQEAIEAAWPRERREVLGCFGVLAHTLAALEGSAALEEAWAALTDVGEWFP